MSWRRNDGQTGANTIPLGNRRRFGGDDSSATPEQYHSSTPSEKRGRSPDARPEPRLNPDGTKKRIKKNRWGDAAENKAAGLMNLPTTVTANFTPEQLEAFVLHVRIEEISQKLRINDVVPADGNRSPSPAPQYDNQGKRVNTREYRYRKKLEDERHKLIEKALKTIPSYHPPPDYRRPMKTQEKVYVPVNDYPEINFIGLLIGPRGNTLKKMETESGAKIAIRGKGSVKEGKGKSDAAHASNQDEDLHCLIIADSEDKVIKAKQLVHNVIETAASIPEGQNELKRNQLRELAALNGTLRDDENQACQNCGEIGHRKYDCPNARNYTANITCRACGNAGHLARDCPERQRGQDWRNAGPPRRENMVENDYDRLMNEIEGGGAPAKQIGWQGSGDSAPDGQSAAPPWQRQGGGTAPWKTQQPSGGPAPWTQNRNQDSYDNGYGNGGGGYNGGGGGGYSRGYDSGNSGGPPPWQQNRDSAAPWQQQNAAPSYGGYGGAQGQSSGGAPWNNYSYNTNAPPPPPGDDVPPPPPPPPA